MQGGPCKCAVYLKRETIGGGVGALEQRLEKEGNNASVLLQADAINALMN